MRSTALAATGTSSRKKLVRPGQSVSVIANEPRINSFDYQAIGPFTQRDFYQRCGVGVHMQQVRHDAPHLAKRSARFGPRESQHFFRACAQTIELTFQLFEHGSPFARSCEPAVEVGELGLGLGQLLRDARASFPARATICCCACLTAAS